MKTVIETTLFHFHDGVLSENKKDADGNWIMEAGHSHLEVVSVGGIPKYSRIIENSYAPYEEDALSRMTEIL